MTPARKQRLTLIGIMVVGVAIAVGFALKAFQENLMFFFSPTEVAEGKPPKNAPFRLGGMVVAGSVRRPEGVKVLFDLSDYHKTITVQYEGILPDLFREGQGMVALGRLGPDGVFIADEVGLFTLIVNTLMLLITVSLSGPLELGLKIHGFWPAFKGALIISVVSMVLSWPTGLKKIKYNTSN